MVRIGLEGDDVGVGPGGGGPLDEQALVGADVQEAARLAEQQRALRVDVDEHDLDGGLLRLVALDDLAHALEQHLDAARQVATVELERADGAARHVVETGAVLLDDAEAGGLEAGVYAQDA